LRVAGRELVFQIKRPMDIAIRNRPAGTFNPTCGPVKPFELGVGYLPSSETPATDGEVRELVF
jgi:hypothetical protein